MMFIYMLLIAFVIVILFNIVYDYLKDRFFVPKGYRYDPKTKAMIRKKK